MNKVRLLFRLLTFEVEVSTALTRYLTVTLNLPSLAFIAGSTVPRLVSSTAARYHETPTDMACSPEGLESDDPDPGSYQAIEI